jgi:hypothetical protein
VTDDDVYRIRNGSDVPQKVTIASAAQLEAAILVVLGETDDEEIVEFDAVVKITAKLKPVEVWYQSIVARLSEMGREKRIKVRSCLGTDAANTGIQFRIYYYQLIDPLDRMASV